MKKDREDNHTHLEENLLKISQNILQYRKLRYNDNITETLRDMYCLKKIEDETRVSEERDEGGISLLNRLTRGLVQFSGIKGKNICKYRGIDGKIYYKSDFISWKKAKPLLLTLRKKIKEGSFDPGW